MSKTPYPSGQTAHTNIGCVIQNGVSIAKLIHSQKNLGDNEFQFFIKFIQRVDGKVHHHSHGGGTPIFIQFDTLRQGNSGLFLTGKIIRYGVYSSVSPYFGHTSPHHDTIPHEWFQPGFKVKLLHRGAASPGYIIKLTNPTNGDKLNFYTKNL